MLQSYSIFTSFKVNHAVLAKILLTELRIQLRSTLLGDGEEIVVVKDRSALSPGLRASREKPLIKIPNSAGQDLSSVSPALLGSFTCIWFGEALADARGHLI